MLCLRDHVEDELDRRIEVPGVEDLEIVGELDDRRPVPMGVSLRISLPL